MTVLQSWARQWFLSLGATAHVQFNGINLLLAARRATCGSGSCSDSDSVPAVVPACNPACLAASCSHAVLMLRQDGVRARPWVAVGACRAERR